MVSLIPNSASLPSRKPQYLCEGNDCHNPAGPGGGQFCSGSGGGGSWQKVSKSMAAEIERHKARMEGGGASKAPLFGRGPKYASAADRRREEAKDRREEDRNKKEALARSAESDRKWVRTQVRAISKMNSAGRAAALAQITDSKMRRMVGAALDAHASRTSPSPKPKDPGRARDAWMKRKRYVQPSFGYHDPTRR